MDILEGNAVATRDRCWSPLLSSFVLILGFSMASCSHSQSDPAVVKAQSIAGTFFDQSGHPGNRFLRLLCSERLTPGCRVQLERQDTETFVWPVPVDGYLTMLHEFPDRHEPDKQLRRLVAFLSCERHDVRFIAETNEYWEVVGIEKPSGTSVSDLAWSEF